MHEGGELRRNVATCFTMSDNDPTKGHAIKYNAHSGAISVEPLQAWKGPARMQTDKEPQLRAARANLEAAERQWQDLKAEEQTINTKIRNCQQEYNDHKQKERRLWNDLRKAEEARDRLKSATTAAMPDEGVLEILEQNLQEAEEAFAFAEGQLEDIFAKQAKLMESKKAIVPTLRAAQAEINQLEKELDELNDRSAHLERKRANTLRDMNNALAKVEGAEKNRDEWEDAKLKQLDEVKRATDMASDICPRVEVPAGMTREQLMAKLEHSRRRREERERM
ncbi:hypothetical protein M011DRAFT_8367 [Sporormia fimetaria CBS 119925]|uniref:Uncharacterized protein n=1 Tax=Sporormia fimetaria CBS 119925 TaxID=1340428 RepID=A0A6A6VRK1_9PLEO|nr:hypothetical protein M011DRAFT_8367 [Sporormia fimetaria CBS 119925]